MVLIIEGIDWVGVLRVICFVAEYGCIVGSLRSNLQVFIMFFNLPLGTLVRLIISTFCTKIFILVVDVFILNTCVGLLYFLKSKSLL